MRGLFSFALLFERELMSRRLTTSQITSVIRPHDDIYVGRTADGIWALYAVKNICLVEGRIGACALVRWCSESESDLLDILELSGKIACIPMQGPNGVYAITQRLM